jgi:hypothetical protein
MCVDVDLYYFSDSGKYCVGNVIHVHTRSSSRLCLGTIFGGYGFVGPPCVDTVYNKGVHHVDCRLDTVTMLTRLLAK